MHKIQRDSLCEIQCKIYMYCFLQPESLKIHFHSLIISTCSYIENRSTCNEVAMLRHHASTVVRNMDL